MFLTVLFLCLEIALKGSSTSTITVPTAGNCGDDTVLTCQVTGSIGPTRWDGLNRTLITNGKPARPDDTNKYTETKGTSSFSLTIHNTDLTDEGEYKCANGFDESQWKRLNIECKASGADISVTNGKKVFLTVDKLYPSTPTISVSFKKENTDVSVAGSKTCSSSTQYSGYYRCVWSSSNSLADGSYTYSIVVKTITQADPLTESFKIVSPNSPVILNTSTLDDNRIVLYGNEGQPLTIQCTSTGGNPIPTVVWYKDSISNSNQLTSSSSESQNDGTYTVTLSHTFTPTLPDDKKTLICRSYYPEADNAYRGSETKTVMLYLRLKPSQPTITQVSSVSSGGSVEVRCTTKGSRPAATITWSYQGSTFTGQDSNDTDTATETYTVVSIFKRQVMAADNGLEVQCVVTHPTLVSPPEITASVNLNVKFPASSTVITGNRVMTATGTAPLTLNCTTGSSNPASDITWKNGSATLSSDRPYMNSTGENNGVVRSQELILTPTRYMDGDVVTCSVSNHVSQSLVTDTVTLDLRYSPLTNIQGIQQITLTEGGSEVLSCTVDSKPLATITWYHDNTQLLQGNPVNSVLNYSLTPVNRTHYGTYRCRANNGISPEDEKEIDITIKFRPLSTSLTGNSNIIANGQNVLSLDCTSGSSNPISDITWKINGQIKPSTYNLSDQSGDYGGKKRQRRLTLKPTRDNDGDVVTCEASNTQGTSEKSEADINLKYRPLIKPMPPIVAVEGTNTELPCFASSKPASTFKWYREGHSGVIYEATGTLDSNQLTYRIDRVNRTDAGTYRCNANNGIETADEESVSLIIHYPPVVNVVATNTSVEATSVSLECTASGIPNNSYFYGKWIQTWPGKSNILKEYLGSKKLELRNLTYEHSGVYTCSASNRIKVFGTNKEYMEGSAQIVVKSYPVIINMSDIVSAKLKENASIQFDFYSNAAMLEVRIYKNLNGSRETVTAIISQTATPVDLPVFTDKIKTNGIRAVIRKEIASKDDFGSYDVVVSNEINSTFRTIEIIPKGPPGMPSDLSVDDIQYKAVSLSWVRGYHGGFPQTFVTQVSTDRRNWRIVSSIFDGKNESAQQVSTTLTSLQDSTTYFLRVYAFNSEGNSSYTDYVNFTTVAGDDKNADSSALIGGVAGGSAAAVVIIVIVVIVTLRRKGFLSKGISKKQDDKNDRKPVYKDEDDYGMQDNPMYVSAGPRNEAQSASTNSPDGNAAVYSTVDKAKPAASNTGNDIYAEVDKTKNKKNKQGKPEKSKHGLLKDKKGKKTQDGDIYENASTTELKVKKTNDDMIYENPEPTKKFGKKNVNKDGLIYADLAFNDQPKGQKKLIIHGIEDTTEYVTVDFTKKADPLPESDDENSTPKN